MATLKIDFNCMCLFVTDETTGDLHVLMPNTSGHSVGHQHVVRMVFRDSNGETIKRPMERWALNISSAAPPQEGEPTAAKSVLDEALIVNLTEVTGKRIDPDLVTGAASDRVISRVTIRGGHVDAVKAQSKHRWLLKEHEYFMAHQVTVRMESVPEVLHWTPLGDPGSDIPLPTLADIKPEGDDNGVTVYALKVYHVLPQDLPPAASPKLNEEAIRDHFEAFYDLLGVEPDADLLPRRAINLLNGGAPPAGMEYCKLAQVSR